MLYDAKEIINLYKDSYGYVSDIESVITFLKNEKSISIQDRNEILLEILRWNLSVDKENKEKLKEVESKDFSIETFELPQTESNSDKKVDSSIIDVSSYIHSLKECDDDDFLTELLPSIYDTNYDSIIGSILLYFFREISIANELLSVEENDEDQKYLKQVIKRNKEIINIIKKYNLEEENTIVESDNNGVKNRLIFLSKGNSSLYIDDDIDDIAIEDDVLPIINDILTGNNTREKRFNNDNDLKGISAIRRRDSRIIFVRLENDTILILGILVKRFQNPQTYRDMLKARTKSYKLQKEELKDKIHDQSFIDENKSIQDRIIEKLKIKRKYLSRED